MNDLMTKLNLKNISIFIACTVGVITIVKTATDWFASSPAVEASITFYPTNFFGL